MRGSEERWEIFDLFDGLVVEEPTSRAGAKVGARLWFKVTSLSAGELVVWRNYVIEVKTGTSLSGRELAQLDQAADYAGKESRQLVYFFLNETTETTVRKIQQKNGSVVHLYPHE